MVPLRLVTTRGSEEIILYENERPNNPHSSRPIRLAFETENTASIQTENQRLNHEISNLESFVLCEDPKIEIQFKGLLTMVDGKVVSALTNQNTCRCNICDKSGPEMAKNEGPFPPVSEERLQFGASPLHFGLRAFEALLHIAYKQDVKTFKVRNPEDKATVAERTAAVKSAFEQELGLVVDRRRDGGFGNTNTGNVVRKAFANAEKTAAICGVPTMLVSNLDVIRRALASSQPINPEKFGDLCEKTLEQYMSCAKWYDIPPSLHRVLVHGKEIVEATPLPIGITSEEGAESNTKFARRFHENHTRKTSQEDTMSDLYHRMMDISDPIVVAMSPQPKTMPEKHLPPDMAELLLTSELDPSQDSSDPEDASLPVNDQEEGTSDFNVSLCNDVDMSSDTE
jgi:putative intracellular protease/amidase